ncbi:uncharacterized protein BXIN_0156 [Babesia sp. Xinjiang]|uniref:uncharacterized protein n=1 Tax=Babesia sp. Xinjiang TaxID=462227 RepID=UPI000A2443A7|nr:uncharacterized protein BXIN_0156 [Babesia sp. Xinjiang]ORM39761.1 hypothetical protein BXIN_0156 [Babesia sp. Xinjiang]
MFRAVVGRVCALKLLSVLTWLLLDSIPLSFVPRSVIATRHGILPKVNSCSLISNLRSTRCHFGIINSAVPKLNPVSVVVHSFWGTDSTFNRELRLDCDSGQSGLEIKEKISSITGVPLCLLRLYVSDSALPDGTRTAFNDTARVCDFPSLLRLHHDTKQRELHVHMELPVPLCHDLKADPSKLKEYAAALRRCSSMLSRVKSSRSKPGLLLERDMATDEPLEAAMCSLNEFSIPEVSEEKGKDQKSNVMFVRPNRRLHLLFFEDFPTPDGGGNGRLRYWLHRHFPIDWISNAKFAFMCYLIKEYCDNDPWVKEALKYGPPICLLGQTRAGRILSGTVFHFLPLHIVPKGMLYV